MDEEGTLERHFLDPDVRDPFPVVAGRELFRFGSHVRGWSCARVDSGGHGGGKGGVGGFGGIGAGESWGCGGDGAAGRVTSCKGPVTTIVSSTLFVDLLAGRGTVEVVDSCFSG